jgi:hypothetical protein
MLQICQSLNSLLFLPTAPPPGPPPLPLNLPAKNLLILAQYHPCPSDSSSRLGRRADSGRTSRRRSYSSTDLKFDEICLLYGPVFTRCDVVGTWSREYQLSSSSSSSTQIQFFTILPSHFFYYCTIVFIWVFFSRCDDIFDNFLTTF